VGAYTADTGGSIYAIKKYNVGKSYVVFGKKDTALVELSDISSGIGGFVIIGALETDQPLLSYANSPLITKPPVPAAISDNSMALVLSFFPNTTYDLPAFNLLL
jgi:hypothetical protein